MIIWNFSRGMRLRCCAQMPGCAGGPIAIMANRRGFLKTPDGPRIGGIIYTESARKVAYFVETADRLGLPLLYLQDVSGFMVGVEAESGGIIRAGAEMVEAMACATVPKIILTLNHASGAGYYAMAGQGFDPHFTFAWPTARIGVMEGDAAVQAVHGPELASSRPRASRFRKNWRQASSAPAPIMNGGWTSATRPRGGMWMRCSIRWKPGGCWSSRWMRQL